MILIDYHLSSYVAILRTQLKGKERNRKLMPVAGTEAYSCYVAGKRVYESAGGDAVKKSAANGNAKTLFTVRYIGFFSYDHLWWFSLEGGITYDLYGGISPKVPMGTTAEFALLENIRTTQAEYLANADIVADEGFDSLHDAATHATDMTTVMDAFSQRVYAL